MTDEIKTELTDAKTTDEVVKTAKTYTEDEVQKLIRERVDREKIASKKALEDATGAKTSLEETLSKYEGILTKQIESKASALPEELKVLFDKLSLAEKIEYLEKYPEKEETKDTTPFPKTPQSNGGDKPTQKTIKKFI